MYGKCGKEGCAFSAVVCTCTTSHCSVQWRHLQERRGAIVPGAIHQRLHVQREQDLTRKRKESKHAAGHDAMLIITEARWLVISAHQHDLTATGSKAQVEGQEQFKATAVHLLGPFTPARVLEDVPGGGNA